MKNAIVMLGGDSKLSILDMFDDLLNKITKFENHLK